MSENNKISKEEVDAAINKIFDNMNEALNSERSSKVSLTKVDETLNALFEAINRAKQEGNNINIPDFRKILSGEE